MRPVVDVLVQVRSASFDRSLSYAVPDGLLLAVGDVVRVPLGSRTVYGFVVGGPRDAAADPRLREVEARLDTARAFDEDGLALAHWMAAYYVCSLREALGAIVYGGAIPRIVEKFCPVDAVPERGRFPSVPPQLVDLIWEDMREGFSLEELTRHPAARRAGDRKTVVRAVTALVRGGVVERRRTFEGPRTRETRIAVLVPGEDAVPPRGPRVRALIDLVRERGALRRADARLAGFSAPVIMRALTTGALCEVKEAARRARDDRGAPAPAFTPTLEQALALRAIGTALDGGAFREILVHGITGSGKTFVYIEAIRRVLADGGAAIVLVPEISLTPQTARRFEAAFGDRVVVLHSALSERERFDGWQAAARGEVAVVVGARSAVFAPVPNLRMIVVDEAHETSYKQDRAPRYHAVSIARERLRRHGGTLILGSATPALEDYAAAQRGEIALVRLRTRATALPLPPARIVDLSAEFAAANRRIFSSALIDALGERIARGEKSVLFVNRRGSASFVLCRKCGHVPHCARCSTSLTAHRVEGLLRCHLCDAQTSIPVRCAKCGDGPIREFGVGTQRVAADAALMFPQANIVRMDSDTTTRIGDHARLLGEFENHGDVLVGTQMVAKGLDFPQVTLVGVVAADLGLHIPDFRAAERTFGLITQVSGRSGRAQAGEVIIQTYSPHHSAVVFAARHDYEGFARAELAEREQTGYPPFGKLIYLGFIGRGQAATFDAARGVAEKLRARGGGFEVLGPAFAPVARVNDEWRVRVALKGPDGLALRDAVRAAARAAKFDPAVRMMINVDP